MGRMKLPGSIKVKKIILYILVIISIGVLVKTAIDNRKYEENQKKLIIEKEADDKRLADEKRVADEKNLSEENAVKKADELEKEDEEKKLYDDAFNTFHLGEYSNAIDKSDLIIKQFPSSYKGYNIRGISKAFNGSFEEGMVDVDKSLELNSDYGYARFNKALIYELYKDYDKALIWYDKALEVEEYLWSYYGKAAIYGRLGDTKNTCTYLQKALEIAKKENVEQQVKDTAKEETDFDPVRGEREFQQLLK